MTSRVIEFPQLEEQVTAFIDNLKNKGITMDVIRDEALPETYGVASRTVVLADNQEMVSFSQLWIEPKGPLDMVIVNLVHAKDAEIFVAHLHKKKFPQQAEGESER